ncbi:MAG: SsrA-binding protein SmpB [Candidatus Cloacimonetes bacterium]|nr:SsrA-binding protein SmpB [Candidatus Cloacimonadota bacterium]
MRSLKNKKAEHDYFLLQIYEAGIVLTGTEVKSIRAGKLNFKDSYARIESGEVWLYNLHISVYEQGSYMNHEPERKRKLLLHQREIRKLYLKLEEKGYTLIPTEIFINEKGLVKINLALAKGKHKYDKREALRQKEELRESERQLKI